MSMIMKWLRLWYYDYDITIMIMIIKISNPFCTIIDLRERFHKSNWSVDNMPIAICALERVFVRCERQVDRSMRKVVYRFSMKWLVIQLLPIINTRSVHSRIWRRNQEWQPGSANVSWNTLNFGIRWFFVGITQKWAGYKYRVAGGEGKHIL